MFVNLTCRTKWNDIARLPHRLHFSQLNSTEGAALGPLSVYKSLIDKEKIHKDEQQEKLVKHFHRLHDNLSNSKSVDVKPGFFSRLFKNESASFVKGMYIYGSVGCGKTMLMDMFYDEVNDVPKKRVHFNEFMLDVHQRIHEYKLAAPKVNHSDKNAQPLDPIPPVAKQISDEIKLLCFDEFQVTDVADAMILKRLFQSLFENGIVVVATSNRPPDDLYKRGLQRKMFLPFIPILKEYCDVVHLNSIIDYRRLNLSDIKNCYFLASDANAMDELNEIFQMFCFQEEIAGHRLGPKILSVLGRKLKFEQACGGVVRCSFDQLCMQPLGAVDYLALAKEFHTIILEDIPVMSAFRKVETRRFITMIDNFYDKKVRLICLAEEKIENLFKVGAVDEKSDSERLLLDDLGIAEDDDNFHASIFTGEEEIFAFDRTKSRLSEMQTAQYWETK